MKRTVVLLYMAGLMSVAANATILADGDFELGAGWPNGWLYVGSGERTAGVGIGGSYGGQTSSDGSAIHGLLNVFSDEINGTWDPTQLYICSFSAKNSDSATNVELGLLGPLFADWEVFTLTTQWQTFSGYMYFPDSQLPLTSHADVFFYQRGAGSVQIDNVSFFAFVPEPATLALLGIGGLILKRRK